MATITNDGLINFTSKMGTSRDKASHTTYNAATASPIELENAYRTSWLARAVIDRKADDATRKWREWHGDDAQIKLLEKEELRLNLKEKVTKAIKLAYLHGGSAIYFDNGQKAEEPLRPTIGKSGIRFLTVLRSWQLSPTDLINDPLDPNYGKYEYYTLSNNTGQVKVHHSRLMIFKGLEQPNQESAWGDSVLMPVFDALTQFEGTCANVNSLVYEAKLDIFSINGLTSLVRDGAGEDRLVSRYGLLAQMKGINGMMVIDKENESYDQKTISFQGLTDIMDKFQQNVSGAAGYPRAILFGTSSGGLGSTGELELSNYYDRINEIQENDISSSLRVFDELLIQSALGSRPSEVFYEWRPLWQMSEETKAKIGKDQVEMVRVLNETRLFDEDALRDAAVNMFNESGTLPGLEALPFDGEDDDNAMGVLAPSNSQDIVVE